MDDPRLIATAGWGFESPRQLPKPQVNGLEYLHCLADVIPTFAPEDDGAG